MELNVRRLTWHEVKERIEAVNPAFAALVEQIDLPDNCYFYETSYRYGDNILENGVFHLPTVSGGLIKLGDSRVPNEIQQDLNYNCYTNPVSIMLDKPSELFFNLKSTVASSYIVKSGDIFGLSRVLNGIPEKAQEPIPGASVWEMVAGARSCFMLPKITDTKGNARLDRTFKLPIQSPNNLQDHWFVFRSIGKHDNWRCNILFFSRGWFEHLNKREFAPIHVYLLQQLRQRKSFWANLLPWNIAFAQIHQNRNINPATLAVDMAKNLFGIASGKLAGFKPALDETFLPKKSIQEAYISTYKLERYRPIIMHADTFDDYSTTPIFASAQFPISESAEQYTKIKSLLMFADEVHHIHQKHIAALSDMRYNIDARLLNSISHTKRFAFYHSNPGSYTNIAPTLELKDEPYFKEPDYSNNLHFPFASYFFNGCIKISNTSFSD